MTGFGRASATFQDKTIDVEIQSVNGKQLDMSLRLPNHYRDKELEVRNLISQKIERGKVLFTLTVSKNNGSAPLNINDSIVDDYLKKIKTLSEKYHIQLSDYILSTILRLPESLSSEESILSDEEWQCILNCINDALNEYDNFRLKEGEILAKDIEKHIGLIMNFINKVEKFEKGRIDKIRERIRNNLNEFIPEHSIDKDRFEQEIIYFLERLDITEEKVRLRSHCSYFIDTMNEDISNGRKLSFITQEIGREINTLGSKANDADIQKIVVLMKDELEKIKEQILNIV